MEIDQEDEVEMENFEHECVECGKKYSSISNLNRHGREKHSIGNATFAVKATMRCPLCDKEFRSRKAINDHLQSEHQVEIVQEHFEFPSLDEFSKWKQDVEKQDKCMYIKKNGSKWINGVRKSMYYCHRSGIQNSRGVGIRRIKLQGSVRMNATCPSCMKVEEKDSKVSVDFIISHVGHLKYDVLKLGIPKKIKNPRKKFASPPRQKHDSPEEPRTSTHVSGKTLK